MVLQNPPIIYTHLYLTSVLYDCESSPWLAARFALAERTTDSHLIRGRWPSESVWTFRRTEKSIDRGMN